MTSKAAVGPSGKDTFAIFGEENAVGLCMRRAGNMQNLLVNI